MNFISLPVSANKFTVQFINTGRHYLKPFVVFGKHWFQGFNFLLKNVQTSHLEFSGLHKAECNEDQKLELLKPEDLIQRSKMATVDMDCQSDRAQHRQETRQMWRRARQSEVVRCNGNRNRFLSGIFGLSTYSSCWLRAVFCFQRLRCQTKKKR